MPATVFILPALVVGITAWIAAWWYTRRHANESRRLKLQRLRNHALWLEQRLDLARQERWDHTMIESLAEQLGEACEELACAQRGSRRGAAITRGTPFYP